MAGLPATITVCTWTWGIFITCLIAGTRFFAVDHVIICAILFHAFVGDFAIRDAFPRIIKIGIAAFFDFALFGFFLFAGIYTKRIGISRYAELTGLAFFDVIN